MWALVESNNITKLIEYIEVEGNVLDIYFDDINKYVSKILQPNLRSIGKKFRGESKNIVKYIKECNEDDIDKFREDGYIMYNDIKLDGEYMNIVNNLEEVKEDTMMYNSKNNCVIIISTEQDEKINNLYYSRKFATDIQKMRKEAKLHSWDKIDIYYETNYEELRMAITDNIPYIKNIVRYPVKYGFNEIDEQKNKYSKKITISEMDINVMVTY